jgi:UDP-N-acetylmuramate--alanine ligase
MLAQALQSAGLSPSFLIGDSVPSLDGRRAGMSLPGRYFVAEACEAFRSLQFMRPYLAVITNIDDEHLEHYGSQHALDVSFADFASHAAGCGGIVACGDDAGVQRALDRVKGRKILYGEAPGNSVRAHRVSSDASGSRFDLTVDGRSYGTVMVPIPG